MTQPEAPHQLDYGPRRPRVPPMIRRHFVLITIIIAMILGAVFWGPIAIQQFKDWQHQRELTKLQRACMTYTAPPDQVVYDDDPDRVSALAATDPEYKLFTRLEHTTGVWRIPVTQENLNKFFSSLPTQGAAFMHRRVTASGEERLIYVVLSAWEDYYRSNGTNDFNHRVITRGMFAYTFKPGAPDTPSTKGPTGMLTFGTIDLSDRRFPMRLYAGQPDPTDASRFTIDYELQGRRGTITGTLKNDGSVWMIPDTLGFTPTLSNISWTPPVIPATQPSQ
jgi:hypothetical protein